VSDLSMECKNQRGSSQLIFVMLQDVLCFCYGSSEELHIIIGGLKALWERFDLEEVVVPRKDKTWVVRGCVIQRG
jgi:hypothetical protein